MATYEIPAEPPGNRVWLLDHPEHGGPLQADRYDDQTWSLALPGGRFDYLSWSGLLAEGVVTDVDPDDVSWLPPVPWTAESNYAFDAKGGELLHVDADAFADLNSNDRLAVLIVRLVNEFVARHEKAEG